MTRDDIIRMAWERFDPCSLLEQLILVGEKQ